MDVITTLDGSSTIVSEHFPNQLYHSDRGAIGEALHTYIQFLQDGDNVLEFGFGSGLNALLSLKTGLNLNYTTLEHYPIDLGTAQKLTFYSPELGQLHTAPWEKEVVVNPNFLFTKHNLDIEQFSKLYSSKLATRSYDRIFFDAFAPDIVPNQWSEEVFSALYQIASPGAQLLTYSSKGIVKQALRASGFIVKRLPGALGKHNMVMATK